MLEPEVEGGYKNSAAYKNDLPEKIDAFGFDHSHKVISTIQEISKTVVRNHAAKCEDGEQSDIESAHRHQSGGLKINILFHRKALEKLDWRYIAITLF